MKTTFKSSLAASALVVWSSFAFAQSAAPPVPSEVNGQKVLVFVQQDPPGTRCNTNMQIADQLEMDGAPKHGKAGKLFNTSVRPGFDQLKDVIKTGK